MSNYLEIANSPVMYIGVVLLLGIVIWQAGVFTYRSFKRAEELNIEKSKLYRAMKIAMLTSIVPSIAIILALITLVPVLGTPISWARLSIIGSLSYELMAAEVGATSYGVELGGVGYDASAFLTSVLTMTIGSFAMLGMTIFGFKAYKNRVNKSIEKKGGSWGSVLMGAIIISLYARFLVEPIVQGGVNLVTMLGSAVTCILMGVLLKKFPKARWLSDYSLSISMVVGMVAAVLYSM